MNVNDLKSLLYFACNFDGFEHPRDVFRGAEKLLGKSNYADNVFVISFSTNFNIVEKDFLSSTRVVLNRENQRWYMDKSSDINKVLGELYSDNESAIITKTIGEKEITFLNGGVCDDQRYCMLVERREASSNELFEFLSNLISSFLKRTKKTRDYKKLENLIYIDDVTGLYNQRKLQIDIGVLVERFEKEKEEFVALFVDIDHFKKVNDGHGHIVGTELLAEVGKLIGNTVRDSDLCYRYGGDEFVILAPNTIASDGFLMGERLLKKIKENLFSFNGSHPDEDKQEMKLSVSIGVAAFPDHASTGEQIIHIADQMMYHAKKSGRGAVKMATDLVESSMAKKAN